MTKFDKTLLGLSNLLLKVYQAKVFYYEIDRLNFFGLKQIITKMYDDKNLIFSELENQYKTISYRSKLDFLTGSNLYTSFNYSLNSLLNKTKQVEYGLIWNFNDCLKQDIWVEVLPVIFNQLQLLKSSKKILDEFSNLHKETIFQKEVDLSSFNRKFAG